MTDQPQRPDDEQTPSDDITSEGAAVDAEEVVDAELAAVPTADGDGPPPDDAKEEEPDYRDLYLRAAAETDNIRKRARRDVEQANARGVARLARELLPALDNLDRALEAAEGQESAEGEDDHPLTKGIRLVQQELQAALTRVGIEQYSPAGEQFDPHQHEAVAQVAAEGAASGEITNVFQAGYRYKDEVLRAAKVTVAP